MNIKDPNKICINCMGDMENPSVPCPRCSFDESQYESKPYHLQPRSILNGKYLIGRVIGEGGFGVTYVGWDLNLNIKVAIKEYYPNGYATRDQTQTTVIPYAGESTEFFKSGKEKFLSEAQKLAQFSNLSGIVSVKDFFLENNTAYIVMEYIDGVTLKSLLASNGGRLPFEELAQLLRPVIGSLALLHRENLIHRDISPDNIMITAKGDAKLIDFGAARDLAGEKSTGIVLKPNFSPEEQYRSAGELGPWTDIYAICATIYRAVTGVLPQEALERINSDQLKSPSELGVVMPTSAEMAVLKGLAVYAKDRYRSIEEFIPHFYEGIPEKEVTRTKTESREPKKPNAFVTLVWSSALRRVISIAAAVIIVAGATFGVYRYFNNADRYASEAMAMLKSGKVDAAQKRYQEALKLDQNNYYALLGYGNTLFDQKDYNGAITEYSKAVKADHSQAAAYIKRGSAESKVFKFDDALADFETGLSNKPYKADRVEALTGKAEMLGQTYKYAEALKVVDQAIALDPKQARAYFVKGSVLYAQNKTMDAMTAVNKAIELDSKYADAYNLKGNAYSNLSKFEESLDMYKKAMDLDSTNAVYKINYTTTLYSYFPDRDKDVKKKVTDILTNSNDDTNPEVLICKAIASEILDKNADANKYCDKALAISKYFSQANTIKAEIMLYGDSPQSHKDEILKLLNITLSYDPNNYSALSSMGCYYLYVGGDQSKGEQYIQKAIDQLPDYYSTYLDMGKALYSNSKYRDSIDAFAKSIQIYATSTAYGYEGFAYDKLGDTNNAVGCLKKAVELGSNDVNDYELLSSRLLDQGNYNDSIKYAQMGLTKFGEDYVIYQNLAIGNDKIGQYDTAEDFIDRAIAMASSNDDKILCKKVKLRILLDSGASVSVWMPLYEEINAAGGFN